MQIGQLYFPLWTIVPAMRSPRDEVLGSSAAGLIEVSLASGQHDFELVFGDGLPERAGCIVTLASILVVGSRFAFVGLRGFSRSPHPAAWW